MRRTAILAALSLSALGLSALGLNGVALAGSDAAEKSEQTEVESGMPATVHQEQAIEGEVEGTSSLPPTGETVEGMPATEHQEQVLGEDEDEQRTTQ